MHTLDAVIQYILLALAAFTASTAGAISGFGGAAVLLPVLVFAVGTRDAVVSFTIAQLVGNGSRVWFNRGDIVALVVRAFALGAVPACVVGGLLFTRTSGTLLTRLLGAFLIAAAIWHRVRKSPRRPQVRTFTAIGAGAGFGSALLGSVGPVVAPFFLAFGLTKSSYIGTEAASTVLMHGTKLAVYGSGGVLSHRALVTGLALAPVMVAGSALGKRVLDRLSERVFVAVIEVVLIVSGLLLLRG